MSNEIDGLGSESSAYDALTGVQRASTAVGQENINDRTSLWYFHLNSVAQLRGGGLGVLEHPQPKNGMPCNSSRSDDFL